MDRTPAICNAFEMEPHLIDPFRRRIEYLRLSVTDRCDLRCRYCLPKGFNDFEEPEHWLTLRRDRTRDARLRRAGRAARAPDRRRAAGTRKGLPRTGRAPARPAGSRGPVAHHQRHAAEKQAGALARPASRASTSASIRSGPTRFAAITGGGKLDKVLAGLAAAKAAGFADQDQHGGDAGVNDDEIEDMVRFCLEHGFTLRLIETMPMGDTGRDAAEHYLDLQEVKRAPGAANSS